MFKYTIIYIYTHIYYCSFFYILSYQSRNIFIIENNIKMIILPQNNDILKESIHKRLTAKKREACELNFADFDGIKFRLFTPPDNKDILQIEMYVPFWADVADYGAKDGVRTHFGKYEDANENSEGVRLNINLNEFENPDDDGDLIII